MSPQPSRRTFFQSAATAGSVFGLGEWSGLLPFGPASAQEARVTPDLVRFGPDIEPVVKLIEETPREKCVAAVVGQFRGGLPCRHFLAALYLAAIRAATYHKNGPHGYDHNAYVVHSAHQLGLDLPAGEQLLPAFLALDQFKGMQTVYPNKKGTERLTGRLPAAGKAVEEFHAAMREWDPDRAERAIVAMARSLGTPAVLEPLWHYACRTWGFIGHMAILVASSARLLDTIGWRHAEHVLRYVAAALAGWGKEHANHPDVLPYFANLKRVEKAVGRLPGDWAEAGANEGLTKDLAGFLREGKPDEACDLAVRHLVEGKAQAGAVWDSAHLAAGELVLSSTPHNERRPVNSAALHANTAANALHHAFRASTQAETRLLLTLQALAWMDLFRRGISKSKHLTETVDITRLVGAKLPDGPDAAMDAILATRTTKPQEASRMAFALAQRQPVEPLLRAARRLIPAKCSGDPHDIKFSVAIGEDLDLVSPVWRPHLTAVAAYSFWGSDRPDLPVIQQVREALRNL